MDDFFNFTVTDICHIHFRMSNPNWGFADLAHPRCYTFVYAEFGKSHYLLNGADTVIEQDQILFFQRGEAHTGWADPEEPWRYFSFGFDLLPLDETQSLSYSSFLPDLSPRIRHGAEACCSPFTAAGAPSSRDAVWKYAACCCS